MSSWVCAQVIMNELLAAGVTDVVLAPGSRNAPLAYAVQRMDAEGTLRLHVRIDERSAAFLALGMAKASGRVVPVITTSGTAVGNVMPAVMEADHAHVPLMIISADRPASMINIGANQTTDQVHFFDRHVRADSRLSAEQTSPAAWAVAVHRLTTEALGVRSSRPGPVHLNVEFSEPLTPTDEQPEPVPGFRVAPVPAGAPVSLSAGPRTVVLCGDASPTVGARARAVAEAGRLPLLAEPSSNARAGECAVAGYRLLLAGELGGRIERVIVFGRPTLSRSVAALLRRADVELIMVSPFADWIDPGLTAEQIVYDVECEPGEEAWLTQWRAADHAVAGEIARAIHDHRVPGKVLGLDLSRAVVESLGADEVLVLGSSSPIRDMDLAPANQAAPRVFANRGLAGIDGTTSTAVGVALATGAPTTLAVGDLAFLHEIGGLLVPASEPQPKLRIVIGHDNGGSIFSTLEQGSSAYADSFERIFGTPHDTDLAGIARGYGAAVHETSELAQVQRLLASPPGAGIELVLVYVDRTTRRSLNQRLAAAVR